MRSIRADWEELANLHLARARLEVRVDHRSHVDRGLAIEPTQHVGVHATQMARRGMEVTRVRLEQEAGRRNAELIQAHPEQVLVLLFAGLKLPVRAAVPEGELAQGETAATPKRSKAEDFTQAVDVFAVAWSDAQRMRGQALPLLAHQEAAMRRAVEGLERVRPGVVQDLAAALHRQPGIAEALARLQGDALAGVLMKGIRQEVRARQELARQAERAPTAEIRRAPVPVPEPVQERTRGRGLSR